MNWLAALIASITAFLRSFIPAPDALPTAIPTSSPSSQIEIVAQELEIPWAMAFLPDRSMLITERPGRIRLLDPSGQLQPQPVAIISEVIAQGEGGLLGLAVSSPYVYLYYTYATKDNATSNRVVRYTYQNRQLTDPQTLIDNIPGSIFHNGGRLKFGPDGYLYITTGDAQNPSLAQNPQSLAGKILRLSPDGKLETYSLGHRNPQGLTWDNSGQLWATEHGNSAQDEINLIKEGKNYGWPTLQGDQVRSGFTTPILQSGSDTWAPAGATWFQSKLYFTGLRGQALFSYPPLTTHLKDQYGRLRDITLGPDGYFYVATSNRDGRGQPQEGDDKILKISPQTLTFTASFSITTLGTRRVFTDPKYHYRSRDVFLSPPDPEVVHVTKPSITWQEFFATLPAPMKLELNCLTTGAGQRFCTGPQGQLRLRLDGIEHPSALSQPIAPDSKLEITFD